MMIFSIYQYIYKKYLHFFDNSRKICIFASYFYDISYIGLITNV